MTKNIIYLLRIIPVLLFLLSCNKNNNIILNSVSLSDSLIEEAILSLKKFSNDTTLLKQELNKRIEQNDTIFQIAINKRLGNLHTANAHYNSSIINMIEYLRLSEGINSIKHKALAINSIANFYSTSNIYDEAFRYYLKTLNIEQDNESFDETIIQEIAKANIGIAEIYILFDNTDKASESLNIASSLIEKINDKELEADINVWKGIVCKDTHRYDSAYIYINKALEEYISLNSTAGLGIAFFRLGQLSSAIGSYEEAIVYLENAKKTLINTSEKVYFMKVNTALAKVNFKLSNYMLAEKHMLESEKTAIELGLSPYLKNIYYDLSEIYKVQNKIKTADHYHHLGHEYEAQLNDNKMRTSLFNAYMDYEKEKNKEELEKIRLTFRSRSNIQNIIIIATSSIIILLIVILFLYKRYVLIKKDKNKAVIHSAQIKTSLYDQISEEIKSPITIINGLIDILKQNINKGNTPNNVINLEIIEKQTQNIYSLIGEALIFSDSKDKITTRWAHGDIIPFLQYLLSCFNNEAEAKGLTLIFFNSHETIEMDFCKERLKIAINNILSIVIKACIEGDKVLFNVRLNKENICIINISQKSSVSEIPNTFKDSIHSHNNRHTITHFNNKLIFTRQLIKDMKGDFYFRQTSERDISYTIELPIKNKNKFRKYPLFDKDIANKKPEAINYENKMRLPSYESSDKRNGTILIVEDNKFMSFYVSSLLSKHYNIIVAQNGIEALKILDSKLPDLIITDLLMPQMDGNQMTEIIKKTPATNHIPIIMITVKESNEYRIESIKAGVDSFLVKPFIEEELLALVDQLLNSRKSLITKLSKIITEKQKSSKNKIEEEDVIFIEKVSGIIHQKINNPNLSHQVIADEMFISTSHLNRRIKSITNLSTTGYILNLRLNRAKKMLITTQKQIGEIAMDCGFNDFAYFSRTFKKEFGITPSQYQRMGTE